MNTLAARHTMQSALKRAIEAAGSQSAFARICGCTQGNIWQLVKRGGHLPAQYVLRVEASTGVSRHDLRPDLYPPYALATPASEARTVTCIACDRRLDAATVRACTDADCPNADREAA